MNYASDKIAFIQSNWHTDIIDEGKKTFVESLKQAGFPTSNIDFYDVPGALEIPLQAKLLAKTGKYSAIACGGFIVNGGIYRHEFVNTAVIDGLMRVSLDTEVPVLSMVLTPINFHESEAHHDFFFDHFQIKGRELAEATLKMIDNLHGLQTVKKAA